MTAKTGELDTDLLDSRDYREFLRKALALQGFGGRRPNFAAFARKAGFSSRSYPREVLRGEKRITPASMSGFMRGLGIRGDVKSYFRLLVAREEPDVNPEGWTSAQIEQRLARIRARREARQVPSGLRREDFGSHQHWQEIYAALGTVENGASPEEVAARTHLSRELCLRVLGEMGAAGAIRAAGDGSRYFPLNFHLDLTRMGGNGSSQTHFEATLSRAARRARRNFASDEALFMESVFSMDLRRSAELKAELRELLMRFVERSESPDGKSLGRLVVAFGKF